MNFKTLGDKGTYAKAGLIRPANEENMPIFMHCAGGSVAVTKEYLIRYVLPVMSHYPSINQNHRLDGELL